VYAKWNKDIEERIEKLLGNGPEIEMDFRESKPFPSRRTVTVFERPNLLARDQ